MKTANALNKDPNACITTGGWQLHGYYHSQVAVAEYANGTLDAAIAAARKVLVDDRAAWRERGYCEG